MGALSEADISGAMQAIADTLEEMGVTDLGRVEATDATRSLQGRAADSGGALSA
jgi:hypothetical protein